MLVLSRQRDETIMIGDEVEVTIVDIRGDKVRLGISAPREVTVHRKEVYEAIKRENRAAAQVRPEDLGGSSGPSQQGGPKLAGVGEGEALRPTVRAASPSALRRGGPSSNGNGSRRGGRNGQRGPRAPEGSQPAESAEAAAPSDRGAATPGADSAPDGE